LKPEENVGKISNSRLAPGNADGSTEFSYGFICSCRSWRQKRVGEGSPSSFGLSQVYSAYYQDHEDGCRS
jgi:hypothetical protein